MGQPLPSSRRGGRTPPAVFTGDVFEKVPVQGLGESKTKTVIVLQHPCALRSNGVDLHSRLMVAELRNHKVIPVEDWTRHLGKMPLPELIPALETGRRHQAAFFDEPYLVGPELFATPDGEHAVENFAIAQLNLATAQLSLNDLDGANSYAQAVLPLPSKHRSVPIIARMTKIDQMLAGTAFNNATLASDLREQIAVFSAYPAARELPQLPS